MKRFLSAVLIALLVLAVLLSACQSGEEPSSAPSESASQPAASEPASEPDAAESGGESSGASAAESIEESSEESIEESSEESIEESFEESSESVPEFDPAELFEVTAPDYTFDIHTPDQAAFLEGSLESIASLADGWHECSKPRAYPVDFTVNREAAPFGLGRFNGCRALLDRDAGFTDPKIIQTYSVTDNGYRIEFTNLLLDATYYYKLQVQYGDTWYESAPYVFYTAAYAPRNLDIEGVSNVRDIGGRFIDDSHRIKQGMIFRGAAFEDAQYGTHITQRGIAAVREDLKIKTEIELRWVSVGEISSRAESLIGGDVNYYEYEFNYDTSQLLVGNYSSIAKCFVRFADESQYPIYYHCRIGTDRTGVLSYLLLGLLGVDKDTILHDYLFSNFGYVGGNRSVSTIQSAYIDVLDAYEGETLQQKITNYLINECGLTEEQLERIKEILIEDV